MQAGALLPQHTSMQVSTCLFLVQVHTYIVHYLGIHSIQNIIE